MRLKNISIFAAVAALSAGLALPHAAAAQGEGAGRFKGASDWVERNVNANTPKRMVYTSARGLGMLRGLQEDDMFVRLRYKGAGTAYVPAKAGAWTAIPLSNYYVEISYPEGGMRVDETTAAGRTVKVVAGAGAWDEVGMVAGDTPPVGASQTPAPAAVRDRQIQLAMTPYGAIKAAHAVIDKVKVTDAGHGIYVLTFPFMGTTMKVTLDKVRRPSRVELPYVHPVIGRTVLVAEYSEYKDYEPLSPLSDEPFSFLDFPARIVHKLGNKTVLDLKVDTCWCTNPYVRFSPQAKPAPYVTTPVSAATPRTAWGKPDLNGIWNRVTARESVVGNAFVNTLALTEDGGANNTSQVREGNYNFEEVDSEYFVKVNQDMPFYKPEMWQQIRTLEENAYRRPADPQYGCKNQGLNRLGEPQESFLLPNKFTTIYTPGMAVPWFREVPIDGRKLRTHDQYEGIRPNGASVGHWDGDTLVVETVDFPGDGQVWYDSRGWLVDAETKITERYRRDGDTMTYDVTVEDPMFVEPWIRPSVTLRVNNTAMLQEPLGCIEYDGDQLPPSE